MRIKPSLPFADASTGVEHVPAGASGSTQLILLLLPAYIALGVAMGAVTYFLADVFSDPTYSIKLAVSLCTALLFSFCIRCGGKSTREICLWLTVAGGILIPPVLIAARTISLFPETLAEDSNALVAVYMGWLGIATVFISGARFGRNTIPLTTPLVPALSLFGLLNIMSGSSMATQWFLTFAAASLYLCSYERIFKRALERRDVPAGGIMPGAETGRPKNQFLIAGQALVACAVWLVIFAAGANLFYYPVSAMLPTGFSVALSRAPIPSRTQTGDWRSPAPVMELTGGNYPLSSRSVAKITVKKGHPSGLWRGNVYSRYMGSRWLEAIDLRVQSAAARTGSYTSLLQRNSVSMALSSSNQLQAVPNPNINHCTDETCDLVIEMVQPFLSSSQTLLSSGQPVAVEGNLGELQVRTDGSVAIVDIRHRSEGYSVRSQVLDQNLGAALAMPGLSVSAHQAWLDDPMTVDTLDLPDNTVQRNQLKAIVEQIRQHAAQAHHLIDTPVRKAGAITQYLADTCRYSLSSPAVPKGEDAVLYFIAHSKRGACDMFASSMVLLLRTMDVPARLVTGYLQPETADNDDGTVYTLREKDAHAWVEYYVPSLGWVSSDPTQSTQTLDPSTSDVSWADFRNLPALLGDAFLPVTGAIALAFTGIIAAVARRKRDRSMAPEQLERTRISAFYKAGAATVSRYVPRPSYFTAHEYEAAVMSSSLPHTVKLEFAALTYLFVQSQYSSLSPETDLKLAGASLQRLREGMRSARPLSFFRILNLPTRPQPEDIVE